MKRTTRISIEFQHREVTITVAGSTLHVQDSEPGAPNTLTVCPSCGSPWITIVAQVNGEIPANSDRIRRALQQSGLHLQVSRPVNFGSAKDRLRNSRRSSDDVVNPRNLAVDLALRTRQHSRSLPIQAPSPETCRKTRPQTQELRPEGDSSMNRLAFAARRPAALCLTHRRGLCSCWPSSVCSVCLRPTDRCFSQAAPIRSRS